MLVATAGRWQGAGAGTGAGAVRAGPLRIYDVHDSAANCKCKSAVGAWAGARLLRELDSSVPTDFPCARRNGRNENLFCSSLT